MNLSPDNIYRTFIENYNRKRVTFKKTSRLCAIGKLVTFLCFCFAAYAGWKMNDYYFIVAVVGLVGYIQLVRTDHRVLKQIHDIDCRTMFCNHEIKALEGDFSMFRDGRQFIDSEHAFAYDLDIFGSESLFQRVNRTMTERGEKILASKLSALSLDPEVITENREAVEELRDKLDLRLDLAVNDWVSDQTFHETDGIRVPSKSFLFGIYAAIATTCLLLVLSVAGLVPFVLFTLFFTVQLSVGLLFSKRLTRNGYRADNLRQMFDGYIHFLRLLHAQTFQAKRLNAIKQQLFDGDNNSLQAFRELTTLLNWVDVRSNFIVFTLLNGLVMIDLLLLIRLKLWTKKYCPFMDQWISAVGEFDAMNSLAQYAFNHPTNTFATLLEGDSDNVLEATDVFHPFLAHKSPVANSFILPRHTVAIITGANMAGKSTFLRTIGVNYILACCGVPVCAKKIAFAPVSLFSSMRTSDNLSKDISYFHAELLRLQLLLRHVQHHSYTLIILDEILKGTNSKDKLDGSVMFLHELTKYQVSGIVATHDLELAKLEEETSFNFVNYCFEIALSRQISYSYKISEGVARNMNASYLLAALIRKSHSEQSHDDNVNSAVGVGDQ